MKRLFPILLIFFSVLFTGSAIAQLSKNEQLANQYMQNGEYDKAATLLEKIYDQKQDHISYKNYLTCLLALKDYNEAGKLTKKQSKKFPEQLEYQVDRGLVLEAEGKTDKARQQYEKTVKALKPNQQQVLDLARAFISPKKYDWAVSTYLKGRKLISYYPFNFELAEVYFQTREYSKMIDEYLDALSQNEAYIQNIQNALQAKLSDDQNGNRNDLLRSELLKKIQKSPEKVIFSEMLLWLFVQEKDFDSALIQAKALDKRLKEDGNRLITLANLAISNENYDAAINAYQYIITKGSSSSYYNTARMELISTMNKKLLNSSQYTQNDLIQLEKEYYNTLNEIGKNVNSAPLIKGLAHLQAFYLNKTDEAIKLLKEVIDMGATSPVFKAECKLELGDIYLMTGEVWEATLLYSQVDKAFKGEPLGEEAKFRNARLSFYRGDFDWAKAQLDVLKSGTSHLIANDALALSLVIQDNIMPDSNYTPLLLYSRADLLLFRNKDKEALATLDSITSQFPGHNINDDVLMKKAQIMRRMGKYEEECALLQNVVDQYGREILGDDALFLLAEETEKRFNNKQKAMELYQDLLVKYPGSTFVVEARKRFRALRGDSVN